MPAFFAQEGKVAAVVPTAISRRWRSGRPLLPWLGVLMAFFVLHAQAADATHDARKKLVMLIAESEYQTAETLPRFADQFLQKDFRVVVVAGSMAPGAVAFSGIDEVADADVL
ncbi:MAG TPA: hypothetical protein VG710_11400, partial [Opitutus sp.]|nr:hypothetical protein [Opitutus sp.]